MKQWFWRHWTWDKERQWPLRDRKQLRTLRLPQASCLERISRYVRGRRIPGQQSWEPREIKGLTFSGKGWEWRELHRHRAPWVLCQGSHTEQLPGRIRAVVWNWEQFYSPGAIWLSGDIFGLSQFKGCYCCLVHRGQRYSEASDTTVDNPLLTAK